MSGDHPALDRAPANANRPAQKEIARQHNAAASFRSWSRGRGTPSRIIHAAAARKQSAIAQRSQGRRAQAERRRASSTGPSCGSRTPAPVIQNAVARKQNVINALRTRFDVIQNTIRRHPEHDWTSSRTRFDVIQNTIGRHSEHGCTSYRTTPHASSARRRANESQRSSAKRTRPTAGRHPATSHSQCVTTRVKCISAHPGPAVDRRGCNVTRIHQEDSCTPDKTRPVPARARERHARQRPSGVHTSTS
jgi:hypothetical protein